MEDFPGFTTAGILKEIQKTMGELQCDPADFKDKIIFMSMFNDIVWREPGNTENSENNSVTVANYARRFPRGRWSFLVPGTEKKWYGTYEGIPSGSWNRTAEKMLLNLAGSGHPILCCTSALERGQLRSKRGGKTTTHFTAGDENVQLLLKMVMSVSQHSLYGAVADLIKELPYDQRAPGVPVALDQMEQEIIVQPPFAQVQANNERQGNQLQDYERRFEKPPEDQKPSKWCSEAGLNLIEVGQFFYAVPSTDEPKTRSLC